MKILNRYLLKSLLRPLVYCWFAFTLIFIINDLFDNFSDFMESGTTFGDVLYYYGLLVPTVMTIIMPVCLLLAMLYSLAHFTRHSEITAMRAGGVSIYRVVLPFIGVGVAATLLIGFINEWVSPDFAFRARQFLDFQRAERREETYFARNVALKEPKQNHVWIVERFDTRDYAMYNVELIQQRPDNSDAVKYQAERALWLDGRWWFTDLTVQRYNEKGDLAGPPEIVLQREMRDLRETPRTFLAEIKDPQYLSSREMYDYLKTRRNLSDDTRARLGVDLHARLALPFACLIVTLIGVPVGSHTGRRGAFAGIMIAVSLFFAFYLLQLGAQALGKQELIPAWLGGWLPVIVFAFGSPVFIHRML